MPLAARCAGAKWRRKNDEKLWNYSGFSRFSKFLQYSEYTIITVHLIDPWPHTHNQVPHVLVTFRLGVLPWLSFPLSCTYDHKGTCVTRTWTCNKQCWRICSGSEEFPGTRASHKRIRMIIKRLFKNLENEFFSLKIRFCDHFWKFDKNVLVSEISNPIGSFCANI